MVAEVAVSDGVPQFGRLIRQHRLRIGLTQRELADFSTISVRAIRDLEQGKATRPRNDTVRLIADGLRLGPRARAALEIAANRGFAGRVLKEGYDAEPPGPPVALDEIIGRKCEIAVIEDELSSGAERLITIVGLGGVGKTRLALEVATRLHAEAGFPVLWYACPGASIDYRVTGGHEGLPGVLRDCVEDVFGIGTGSGGSGVQAFTELTGDRPALLVVDGVGVCELRADRLARLLHDCPELRLLMTADRPCGVRGERPFLLAPLGPPSREDETDLETFGQVPAVRLFLDLARKIRPGVCTEARAADVALVADICRRLDGLPFALRAAASWLLVYDLETLHRCLETGPAELLDHLAGAEGGPGLFEALDRCIHRLGADDQALLTALCERSGSFGLDDVVALTGQSLPGCGRMVRGLLLHGLVRTSQESGLPSFHILNLVRAFELSARHRAGLADGASGATAARMPEQLPCGASAPVSHEVRERAMP